MKNNMDDRPIWFVMKMKQSQVREIAMYLSPLSDFKLSESEETSPIKIKYKIPEHLRRKKKK